MILMLNSNNIKHINHMVFKLQLLFYNSYINLYIKVIYSMKLINLQVFDFLLLLDNQVNIRLLI